MKRDWKKTKYRVRIKEYLFFANRLKRQNCKVMLSSIGPYSANKVVKGDNHPFEVIYHWESHGELLPTTHPEALEWIMIGKAARDWHISEWGQGMAEGVIRPCELTLDGVPQSLVDSAKKRRDALPYQGPSLDVLRRMASDQGRHV
jgi:hypothetical protein